MGDAALRNLPSVSTLLSDPDVAPLLERYGHWVVTEAIRQAIGTVRTARLGGDVAAPVTTESIAQTAASIAQPHLRRVINATGVIVHTNLGRAPLARAAQDAVARIAGGYSNLELDLESGHRGSRHDHITALIATLTGADDGIAVNNCAGAVLLMLASLCQGREVIVPRSELVEIGGGFRVPDVMRQSGAQMVEIGTTNRVHLADYERALTDRTAAILSVHRSNFAIVGFTAQPTTAELAQLAKRAGVPLLVDVGSGLLADYATFGEFGDRLRDEPRPADVLERGAAAVVFSGDKLLGGPQAGIIAGEGPLIDEMRRHPLARALRADKLTLAGLEATLRLYRDGRADEIPVVQMMAAPLHTIEARAHALKAALADAIERADIAASEAVIGGGSLPMASLPSRVVRLGEAGARGRALSRALRRQDPAVMTRMIDDRVAVDLRTVFDEEVPSLAASIRAAAAGSKTAEVY